MATETVIARWGNSLGLRIPKGIATDMELKDGDAISIETTEDGIILKKNRKRPEYSLEELLRGVTNENRHPAVDWGAP